MTTVELIVNRTFLLAELEEVKDKNIEREEEIKKVLAYINDNIKQDEDKRVLFVSSDDWEMTYITLGDIRPDEKVKIYGADVRGYLEEIRKILYGSKVDHEVIEKGTTHLNDSAA